MPGRRIGLLGGAFVPTRAADRVGFRFQEAVQGLFALDRTTSAICPCNCPVSTRIVSFNTSSGCCSPMLSSPPLPGQCLRATKPPDQGHSTKVRKIRYVITGAPFAQERVGVEPAEGPARAVILSANAERSARGLGRLEEWDALRNAAEWMAGDMVKRYAFDQTDSQGRYFAERLRPFGYADARLMAENIGKAGAAAGVGGPQDREAIRTIEVVAGNFGMVPSR